MSNLQTTLYPCLFFIVLCNWRNLSIFLFLSPHLFLCKNRQPAAAISLSKSERRNSIKSDKILNTKKSALTTRTCSPVCLVIFLRVAPWTLLCKYRHYCYWLHKPCKDINIFILLSYSPNLGCYLVLAALSRRQQTRARKSTIFGQSSQRTLQTALGLGWIAPIINQRKCPVCCWDFWVWDQDICCYRMKPADKSFAWHSLC